MRAEQGRRAWTLAPSVASRLQYAPYAFHASSLPSLLCSLLRHLERGSVPRTWQRLDLSHGLFFDVPVWRYRAFDMSVLPRGYKSDLR